MTVRFLTSWNGYSAGDRATLSGSTETALIAGGIARADYVQDEPSPKFPPNANEAAAVVGAAGLAGVIKRRVALGIIGQSNERGAGKQYRPALGSSTLPASYVAVYGRAADGQQDPIAPSTRASMSMWPSLVQLLAQRGVQARVVNGAIGSLSFIGQTCGQVKSWSANREFFAARTPGPAGDRGDKGDLILVSGRVWRCTTGNGRYAFFEEPDGAGLTLYTPGGNTGVLSKQLDYIQYDRSNSTLLKTGATQPGALSSAGTEGVTTVTDGGIVWTLISNSATSEYTSFNPFPRTLADFDPLGVLARLKTALDAAPSVDERWIIISNGQSDAQGSVGAQATIQGWYRSALETICGWATNNGYKVLIGFTCANPNDELQSLGYRWVTLDAAWAQAVASRANGSTVFAGANLYRSIGTSPPVYPESGLVAGVHLTDEGLIQGAEAWRDAIIAAGF